MAGINDNSVETEDLVNGNSGNFKKHTCVSCNDHVDREKGVLWLKKRLVTIILICVGFAVIIMLVFIFFGTSSRHDISNHVIPDRKWYDMETVYEILTESFQDSSAKADNGLQSGDGVGDLKGKCFTFKVIHVTCTYFPFSLLQ